jgi:glycosyltransferase involved in cell wall biosynthesis
VSAVARVLLVSGSAASATLRYRVRLPEEALRSRGVATAAVHVTDPRAAALADRADVVVLYRAPAGRELVALLESLRSKASPPLVTYDVDDRVFRAGHLDDLPFLDGFSDAQRATFTRDVRLRERLVPYADVVTASTQELLDELAKVTDAPGRLLPNGVGVEPLRLADGVLEMPRLASGGTVLGYFSGSATHALDWQAVESAVVDVLRRRPSARLLLVGQVEPSPALDPVRRQVTVLPRVGWQKLAVLLASVDLTLAPLAPGPFTEAKSAIKWLEAALVRTPTVATATGPFRAAVDDGRTGVLVPPDGDWTEVLLGLVDDEGLRRRLGSAAREAALASYGPAAQADRLLDALGTAWPRRPAPDGTAAVADLQALWSRAPVRLEPYPFRGEGRTRVLRVDRSRRPAAAATAAAAAAGGVARRVRRRFG